MEQKEIIEENTINNISLESSETNKIYEIKNLEKEDEILKLFCSDIEKINEKDECNWTPLYRSVIAGNLKASEVLLNNGANPNIQCSMGETSLYQAVDMEKIEHVKLLLKYGADPNISQIDGLSSLHLAVSKQNILIIKYLLKFNANPNKQSTLYKQTPVHLAIKNNVDSMILLILVNCGGSLTLKDKFGKKPIDYINSEEMRKTVEMLKLEKNNDNYRVKKIYFTPSKKSKLTITNVISKTIQSQSPKLNNINQSNIIAIKDSGKAKFNFIEYKSGEIKNGQNDDNNKENINNNLKINLFTQNGKGSQNFCNLPYKKIKFNYYKNANSGNNNIHLNKTSILSNIQSPIEEESYSNISSNKINKNDSVPRMSQKIKNRSSTSVIKSNNSNNTNNTNNTNSTNNNNVTELKRYKYSNSQSNCHNKYLRKKTADKISCFKFESNKNIKKNDIKSKLYNMQENIVKKPMIKSHSNKNFVNSRNVRNAFEGESTLKNKNFLSTNSITDIQTNYKTNLTTNSNKVLLERNSLLVKINENKENQEKKDGESIIIDTQTYNKPKIFNNMKDKDKNQDKNNKFMSENPLFKNKIMRNKNRNKNFFNSKNNTLRHYPTNKILSRINHEPKSIILLNTTQNKDNSSNNIKLSFLSGSTRMSNYGKNTYFRNTHNSSQSLSQMTYYTYSKNDNNSLLEVMERNTENNNFINKKETLPIYKWLKEIDLLVYLPLFLKKRIFSFQKIISDLKSKKIIITPNKIKKLGIETPGHIYRIFVKLEIDAELIDKKIYEYLLSLKKDEEKIIELKPAPKENEESINSVYDCGGCGGCCSIKQASIKVKIDKPIIGENKVYVNLDKWLENINMIKYKENFVQYGFDKIEFFILQMFSSIPLEEKIIEKEMNIDNNNDIDMFILQLNKDVKLISHKIKKKRSSSVEVEKNSINKYLESKEVKPKKKMARASSNNNNCIIF